jgi:putative membrane protein
MDFGFKLSVFLNSMIYALSGTLLFWISFVIIDKLTPYNLWKELVEERNVALAIVVGATAIGISTIVAAAIHG